MLHFDCPSCKAKCESAASTVGMTIACPHCGKRVIVPDQATATVSGGVVFRNIVLVLVGLALVGLVIMLVIPEGPGGKGGPSSSGTNPVVLMETTMGTITMELYADKAPISVANFLKYVDDKFYDGTIFHRVMPGFMIQCGGFLPGMIEKPTREQIKNESNNGLSNLKGTLAMARTNVADSATSQFFINVVDNARLDRGKAQDGVGYAVFGRVTQGMDVVDSIRFVATRDIGPHESVPRTDVIIKSIRRL